jgi:hypothetical protein
MMKIQTTTLLWLIVANAAFAGQVPTELRATGNENTLHALVRVGRAGSIALGIVQGNDGALCRTITGIVPDHPENPQNAIRQLAWKVGYEVTQSEGALVISPHIVQGQLATAVNYRLPQSRRMEGTMRSMGNELDGRLAMLVGKAKGYASSDASSSETKSLTLPESTSSTTSEIASRITGLGPKGVWILSEHPNHDNKAWAVRVRTYSYEDDVWSLERLPCAIPPPDKSITK